jgi:hypothetical protein
VTEQSEGNGRRQAGTLAPDRLASTAKAIEVRHLTLVERAERGKGRGPRSRGQPRLRRVLKAA